MTDTNLLNEVAIEIDKYMAQDARALRSATINYYNAERELSTAKHDHDSLFNTLLAEGVLVGKNEATRYGSFIIEHPEICADLQTAEEKAIDARRKLEMARIDHSFANKRFQLFQMFAPTIAESAEGVSSLWYGGDNESKPSKPEPDTQSAERNKGSG